MPILVGIFGSFTSVFGIADTAFVFGGYNGSAFNIVENYQFSTPGTKGAVPTTLSSLRSTPVASGNGTNCFVLGGTPDGSYASALATGENYLFSTATKGSAPANLAAGIMNMSSAGNDTVMFVFGGGNASSTAISSVESYNYATGTKNSAPAALAAVHVGTGAASNMYNAFVFGGYTNPLNSTGNASTGVENYSFATPGTKGTSPASMIDSRFGMGAGANGTNAFIFGGENGSGTDLSSCENYVFATPGTKGTSPAATSTINYNPTAAANQSNCFVFGGYNSGITARISIVENYQFSTPGTKGTAGAALTSARNGMAAASNRSTAFLLVPSQTDTPTDVMFVIGGYNGTSVEAGCEQYIFATGAKGTAPVNIGVPRSNTNGSANTSNMFVFGGYTGTTGTTTVDNYQFATPGTLGTTPATLGSATPYDMASTSNNSVAFVFGGWNSSGGVGITAVEQYIFATPGSKGTAPTSLAAIKQAGSATGTATVAFVYGGYDGTSGSTVVEQYIFATPGSKGTTPAALANGRYGCVSSGNSTRAFVYGGITGAGWATSTSTTDHYIYATPGSKGTSPTALSTTRSLGGCAGNATNSFLVGGGEGGTPTIVATNYNYVYASATTTTAPANLSPTRSTSAAASNNRGF